MEVVCILEVIVGNADCESLSLSICVCRIYANPAASLYVSPTTMAATNYLSDIQNTSPHLHHKFADNKSSDQVRDVQIPHNGEHSAAGQSSANHSVHFQNHTSLKISPVNHQIANYFHSSSNNPHSYLHSIPATNESLRQPTMFALSLQNEESNSTRSSPTQPSASKTPSSHNSKLLENSSKVSALRQSGLVLEQRVEEGNTDKNSIPTPTNHTPQLQPLSHSCSSMPLRRGRKDFASLTSILDSSRGSGATAPTLALAKSVEHLECEGSPPKRSKLEGRRDWLSLTRLDTGGGSRDHSTSSNPRQESPNKIIEVVLQKNKEESKEDKKVHFKSMSRLEKLTSLEYIRQSFRMKKVSFEQDSIPESNPTKSKSKKGFGNGKMRKEVVITNEFAQKHVDNGSSEWGGGRLEQHGEHASSSMMERFPPEDSDAHTEFQPEQHPDSFMDQPPVAQGLAAPHSQSTDYNHSSPDTEQVRAHDPPLTHQHYSKLSQEYSPETPYHLSSGDPLGCSLDGTMKDDIQYHHTLTPNYSDIFTPEDEPFEAAEERGRIRLADLTSTGCYGYMQGSDEFHVTSDPLMQQLEEGTYREGMLGDEQDYSSNGFTSDISYIRDQLEFLGPPQPCAVASMGKDRGRCVNSVHLGSGQQEKGGLAQGSPRHYALSHQQRDTGETQRIGGLEHTYLDNSETSEGQEEIKSSRGQPSV